MRRQLLPTCPLRTAADIESSFRQMIETNASSQISVTQFGWLNPWWAFRRDSQFRLTPLFAEATQQRSKDLPPLYEPVGAIWWAKADILRQNRNFYVQGHTGWEIPWERAVDIDTEEDWRMAEFLKQRQPAKHCHAMRNSLALYTTIYNGAETFLSAWYQSVLAQTDREFDVWIGADQIEPIAVFRAVGAEFPAHWVGAAALSTPAQVRQAGINAILASENGYSGIVFVDCDDVMLATRVESARAQLESTDVAACAMEIVDEGGDSLNSIFQPGPSAAIPRMLARANAFGMSNTAYRTDTLRGIPATPPQCVLMDWFIATSAWIRGTRFQFDSIPRMQYRQYSANTARVLSPFTSNDIRRGTALVLDHYNLVLSSVPSVPDAIRSELESARTNAQLFLARVVEVPAVCEQYVHHLNSLSAGYLWWEWVAHPSLEYLWKS